MLIANAVRCVPPQNKPTPEEIRTCRPFLGNTIAVHRPPGSDMATVLVVEDNLVKGAAGQAVQNMNLMFGLPESTGLAALPVLP